MKAIKFISIIAILTLGSCASRIYTGLEYDDLYYRPSDQPITRAIAPVEKQVTEDNLKARDYYDNVYAADTLVSDEYAKAAENSNAIANQNINNYNFDSYAGRLRSFYGNYFYPYWRDPFYYSYGLPSLSFGFGYGYPYYSDPFMYDPFMYDYGYYGGYYGMYGGYYGGMYGYNPFYSSYYPYYNNYYSDVVNPVNYGRRERQSNYSSTWNNRLMPATASARRSGYLSGTSRSVSNSGTANPRRFAGTTTPVIAGNKTMTESVKSSVPSSRNQSAPRVYNNSNRTYTPSYNNPRLSTRPSYNNNRVNSEINSNRSYSNPGYYRNIPSRSSSSVSSEHTRSTSSYSRNSYSMPARRSVESGGYSSGSFNSGRSYSGGSGSRSSYSSGSESRSSGSSFSSGSSGGSGGGSSRSSGGSSSSGGRR